MDLELQPLLIFIITITAGYFCSSSSGILYCPENLSFPSNTAFLAFCNRYHLIHRICTIFLVLVHDVQASSSLSLLFPLPCSPLQSLVLGRWCFLSQRANFLRWEMQPIMVLSLLINGQNLGQQGGSIPIYCVK